ncbi:MMPL family transporter [Streptomyces palmae]|uniref:MMPL family transporter n=1 Tax=Streptomyces palmae TaxID=1701085 RepID=UPI001432E3CC|nr:MMPL family transporter [Streptomyces palmae]
MAMFLSILGRFAFRRRRLVALCWLALLMAVGAGAASVSAVSGDSITIPGTEAQRAFDLLDERFPGSHADGATARVVFRAPSGEKLTDAAHRDAICRVLDELRGGPGSGRIARITDPYRMNGVSDDGRVAYAQVFYRDKSFELDDADRDALRQARHQGRAAGLTVEVGGDALQELPHSGMTEAIGVGVAAVVLVVTFGSLAAAGLPLITAIVGVGISVSAITVLSGPLELGGSTPTLAMMLGLAVGIDYAMFIVSRYRAERVAGSEPEQAIGQAAGTAGSAVFFAGLTVVIALVGLGLVGIPALTTMGLAAAGAVLMAVLIAITLVPALLGFVGHRVLPRGQRPVARHRAPKCPAPVAAAGRLLRRWPAGCRRDGSDRRPGARPNIGTRWARFVLCRPVGVLITAALALGVLALPAADLRLGLPDDSALPTSNTQRRAYDTLSKAFGPGFNGPLTVVVDVRETFQPKEAVELIHFDLRHTRGVAEVSTPVFNAAKDTATITVVPAARPSSARTEQLVADLRRNGGDALLVTGLTAMNIDVSRKLDAALVPYLALVVGLAFVLLMLVFRSVLVPLKAALGFLLSVLAALGAVVAVFQWGWLAGPFGVEETGPVVSMMPIFVVGVVFGLAMDYEVFLVTRMREAYVHGDRAAPALVAGFRHGARVVAAAAIIMISVFSGFIGSSEQMIKMVGFGLAVAVFFDAFFVRMAIVPAVLALLGKSAWWLPAWLDLLLPRVDVEGTRLAAPGRGTGKAGADRSPDAAPEPPTAAVAEAEPVPDTGRGSPPHPAEACHLADHGRPAEAGPLFASAGERSSRGARYRGTDVEPGEGRDGSHVDGSGGRRDPDGGIGSTHRCCQ